jgi:hypothetical protein
MRLAVTVLAAVAIIVFALPAAAYAVGRSATGELAFYPCTQCHPVTIGADGKPTEPLPIDMEQHVIELQVHDTLGEGSAGCLACHDDPTRNPGMLVLPDGSLVEITGDVSRVCQRCHFEKYSEWKAGIHGKGAPKCSAAGCHDPHTPSWIYMAALPPFLGTGVEVRAVADREPFMPLPGPPVYTPVVTPVWLVVFAVIGAVFAGAMIGYLLVGRSKR